MDLPDDLDHQGRSLRRLATRLVADADLAEDVVQDAWLRALRQPPQRRTMAAGWMRRVVRNLAVDSLRARRRRERVERALAGDGTVPDVATRGLDLQLTVLDAVRSLPEPYRSTIWQRFFEDRPPRDIAAASGLPVKTVKTRLHRALAMLRERLDAEHDGDRRVWAVPLLTLARPEFVETAAAGSATATASPVTAATVTACTAIWSLLMKTTALRLSAIAILVAGALVMGWPPWSPNEPAPPPGSTGPSAAKTAAADTGERQPAAATLGDTRERVAVDSTPATAATRGGIVLSVLWHEREPAAGVGVALRRAISGRPLEVIAYQLTDAEGRVAFQDLEPGSYRLRADRGQDLKAVVAVGESTTAELVLDAGIEVVGGVVDATGRPAPGARVWLQTMYSDWAGGRVIAVADGDGRFRLRAVPAGLSLGALAAAGSADARSELVDLDLVDTTGQQAEIQLVLGATGGRITGVVRDADSGSPLADLRVALGTCNSRLDVRGERIIERWTPRVVRSDPQGRFAFEGVAAGEHHYATQAGSYGLLRGTVEVVANETANLELDLLRTATLFGTVRDASGEPRPHVAVRAYDRKPGTDFIQGGQIDFDEVFGHVGTLTDADGRFQLDDITPGSAHLVLQQALRKDPGWGERGSGLAYLHEILDLGPGEAREWNPVLDDGRVIEGRALYRDGHPLVQQFVSLRDAAGGERATLVTNSEGQFRFVCLTEPVYQIYVQVFDQPRDAPPVQQTGVVPDQGPVEIRASFDKPVKQEPAVVVGRVVDAGGRLTNPRAATVLLVNEDHSWHTTNLDSEGRFEFERVEPGLLRLVVVGGDTAGHHGDPFTVDPAARHDLGTVTTSPISASVHVKLLRAEGGEDLEPSLYLRRADGRRGATSRNIGSAEVAIGNLEPGDYQWTMYCTGVVPREGNITLQPDLPAKLEIPLTLGASCKLDVRFDADAELGEVTLVYERDGAEFLRRTYQPGSALDFRRYHIGSTLPPGEWRAVMTTTTGLRAETRFAIRAPGEPVEAVLELR